MKAYTIGTLPLTVGGNSMRKSLKEAIKADPFYETCIYPDCIRVPEWEHALTYAGRKIEEKFAIVPVCPYHHRLKNNGKPVDKRYHEWVAINRMTPEDEAKYPRVDWSQKRNHLNKIYGQNRRDTLQF